MAKFEIRYGLGGGFGGAQEWEDCDVDTIDEAEDIAHQEACETYEMYDGMHGLQSTEDIKEDYPDWSDELIEEEWRDQRESWIDYEAREKK